MSYRLQHKSKGRTLVIKFTKDFPYKITSWEETYGSGKSNIEGSLTTKATIKKTILVDYWNKNKTVDLGMRKELGLD